MQTLSIYTAAQENLLHKFVANHTKRHTQLIYVNAPYSLHYTAGHLKFLL